MLLALAVLVLAAEVSSQDPPQGALFQSIPNLHRTWTVPRGIAACSRGLPIVRNKGDNVFLPPADALHPCPERAALSTETLRRLDQLQFPSEAAQTATLYEEDISGMSSTMMTFAMCMLDALAKNTPFEYFGKMLYSQGHSCARKDYQCWFEPYGNVSASSNSTKIHVCQDDSTRTPVKDQAKHGFGEGSPLNLVVGTDPTDICVEAALPEEMEPADTNWQASAALKFVMRPNKIVRAELVRAKSALRWPSSGGVIGMHVRHTDACWEAGRSSQGYTCNQFADYMRDAQTLRDKYGVDTIFLATDNQYVVDHQVHLYPEWKIMRLDIDRHLPDDDWGDKYLADLAEAGEVGLQGQGIVLDMLLLADCDYFVGHADSMVSKAALHLMTAHKNYNPPFILKMPVPWKGLGCQPCLWWYTKVKKHNKQQVEEAQEICEAVCPKVDSTQHTAPRITGSLRLADTTLWNTSPNYLNVTVLRHGIPLLVKSALLSLLGNQLPTRLIIHMIGASDDDEARADWQLLGELLAEVGVTHLTVWLVGPHILTGSEPCKTCGHTWVSGEVHCAQGLYHDWLDSNHVPDAAFMMNCGIAGEFADFTPTLTHLRDKNILTVVTNYWYEPASLDRSQMRETDLGPAPELFLGEPGNLDEMWSNEMALEALSVQFVTRWVRSPFSMRFGLLELPHGVAALSLIHI
eukprot:TRINITY_DN8191_c0_g1_i4.p1 TRINITY_DN8191_c0_g1~~TRINITY_DN8191_c0_g1_i4.p1  ORF type:complete len:690 (+),score=134.24 TRINITY_DN8191_c0_g1_i4:229-2298(+)